MPFFTLSNLFKDKEINPDSIVATDTIEKKPNASDNYLVCYHGAKRSRIHKDVCFNNQQKGRIGSCKYCEHRIEGVYNNANYK